jgi:thiamine biosynthesis lipoprotein
MGAPFRLVFYATNAAHAESAAEAAFARVEELNAILSHYDPDSEVSRLCRDTPVNQPVKVSADLWHVLVMSQDLARRTDGAFDVTVGPVVNLWRRSRRRNEFPPEDLLASARARVGWTKLKLESRLRTVTLLARDMRLDFGGIAKGYAADEALRVLQRNGIHCALIAAAGDIRAGEPPPEEPGWRIEIGQLDGSSAPPPRTLLLHQGAVATSGDLFQYLEIGGRRYSHILDPRTGIGLTDHSLVTVLAPTSIVADSLATAVSVMGPRAGLELVEETPRAAALILRSPAGELEVWESRRLPRWLRVGR